MSPMSMKSGKAIMVKVVVSANGTTPTGLNAAVVLRVTQSRPSTPMIIMAKPSGMRMKRKTISSRKPSPPRRRLESLIPVAM